MRITSGPATQALKIRERKKKTSRMELNSLLSEQRLSSNVSREDFASTRTQSLLRRSLSNYSLIFQSQSKMNKSSSMTAFEPPQETRTKTSSTTRNFRPNVQKIQKQIEILLSPSCQAPQRPTPSAAEACKSPPRLVPPGRRPFAEAQRKLTLERPQRVGPSQRTQLTKSSSEYLKIKDILRLHNGEANSPEYKSTPKSRFESHSKSYVPSSVRFGLVA
eukprot:TRINITY_DN20168_c0_g1_i1.p1 TRINITY_DN20168_c0_g1~~TRINITY_DN20168_c0_g1_i1.p1  ORF type:complete len:219 (-),score=23.75 TRINITY_DN20168_c0_g1_i1:105-761(-)